MVDLISATPLTLSKSSSPSSVTSFIHSRYITTILQSSISKLEGKWGKGSLLDICRMTGLTAHGFTSYRTLYAEGPTLSVCCKEMLNLPYVCLLQEAAH